MTSTGSEPIRSLPIRSRVEVLDPDQVAKVYESALEILRRVGVGTSSDKLLKLMADHGQNVDFQNKRIRFAPEFVEEKRALAPSSYTLAGRARDNDLLMDGTRAYLGPDGCAPQILDTATGERRTSTKEDLGLITRLADALPELGFLWRSVSASDMPPAVSSLHEVEVQLANTTKHLQTGSGTDAFNARGVVEMCRTVAGDAEALREYPLLSSNQCIISPLFWDQGPIDCFEIYAEAGIPISIISMALTCATAPSTIAGLLALTIAEVLSGLVILQTMSPGAKAVCTGFPSTMDLRSGSLNLASGPDDVFAHMACAQIFRHLGLPCESGMLGTGAKASNWQAGVQSTLTAATHLFVPADLFTGAGGLYAANVFSMTQLVLDCEIFNAVARWAEGYSFDDEHLGLDAIEAVGPAGHFLASRHTRRHMGESWRSRYFDSSPWEQGQPTDGSDAPARAEDAVRRILAEHEPEPLAEGVKAELRNIVATYEAEASGA